MIRSFVSHRSAMRVFVCALIGLLALTAGSCSMKKKVRNLFGGMLPIEVTVSPDANEDSPVAVDFVIVYNQKLLDEILKMPASQWFAKREQLLADHRGALLVASREWVPGQEVEPVSLEYRAGARSIVLFADYQTDGEHRAAVGAQQRFRLVLGESDLAVEVLQ